MTDKYFLIQRVILTSLNYYSVLVHFCKMLDIQKIYRNGLFTCFKKYTKFVNMVHKTHLFIYMIYQTFKIIHKMKPKH